MANPFRLVLLMTGLSYPTSPAFKSRFRGEEVGAGSVSALARGPSIGRNPPHSGDLAD